MVKLMQKYKNIRVETKKQHAQVLAENKWVVKLLEINDECGTKTLKPEELETKEKHKRVFTNNNDQSISVSFSFVCWLTVAPHILFL